MNTGREITAIILAGGLSRRMGTEKGLVEFRGKTLISYVIDAASEITDDILIISSQPKYRHLGYPCEEDLFPGRGPLGGIFTGLTRSATEKNLFLGCDMPYIHGTLLRSLTKLAGPEDVLLSEHLGMSEPLCSVYDRACLPHIRQRIEEDQLKITDALAGLNTRVISFDGEPWFRGNEFTNFNYPEDLGSA